MPAHTTTVLQLSDVHYAATPGGRVCNGDPHARLTTVLAAAGRTLERVDVVVLTGDQTHHGDVDANRRLREMLAAIGAPILAAPGNHDDARSHNYVFGPAGTLEIGAWRVLTWDTCVAGEDHGDIDVATFLDRMDELDDRPTIVALHHPPVAPTVNPVFQLGNGEKLLAALPDRPSAAPSSAAMRTSSSPLSVTDGSSSAARPRASHFCTVIKASSLSAQAGPLGPARFSSTPTGR
jgi:3',5'-cyclic-AMP phosphodiesterase